MPPTSTVRIRMYRVGLGDCFLLTFPIKKNRKPAEYHILIDCGVITGSDPAALVSAVKDIDEVTHRHLDLVVGTHEHWDHLSGFNQARTIFDQFQIDNVWLAWTEDPDDQTAQGIRDDRKKKLEALRAGLVRMAGMAVAGPGARAAVKQRLEEIRNIHNLLSFFGDDPAASPGLGQPRLAAPAAAPSTGISGTTKDAILYLASRKDAHVQYCYPSKDPLTLEGVEGVQVYVFGPPEDTKKIKRTDAPSSQKGKETYGIAATGATDSFIEAVGAVAANPAHTVYNPFDDLYGISPDEAKDLKRDAFFDQHYGFAKARRDNWRRIEDDWMNMTGELALNLDSATNNTSLVLAFELGEPGSGKVLLFAADAQVGSWETWPDLQWTVKVPGKEPQIVTGRSLMSRNVLYKVGHHGSHNATLREGGLELMTSDDLVAMIPVFEQVALDRGWHMPFDKLNDALVAKTKGRVMRGDRGLPERLNPSTLTDAGWKKFMDSTKGTTGLYVEYLLKV